MNALHRGGGQARGTMAELNAIVGAGDLRMQDLVGAMSTGIVGAAQTFHISLKSVGAALDTLTQQGTPAQQSATRLRMAITLLAAPSKNSAKMLQAIGASSSEVTSRTRATSEMLEKAGLSTTILAKDMAKPDGLMVALTDLKKHMVEAGLSAEEQSALIARAFGGGRMGTSIMQLFRQLPEMQKNYNNQLKITGQYSTDWAKTQQTTAFKVEQTKASLDSTAIKIGQDLEPAAKAFLGDVEKIAHWFETLPPNVRHTAEEIAALAAVISPVALAVGTIGRVAALPIKAAGGVTSILKGSGITGSKGPIAPGSRVNPIVVAVEEGGVAGLGSQAAPGTTRAAADAGKVGAVAGALRSGAKVAGGTALAIEALNVVLPGAPASHGLPTHGSGLPGQFDSWVHDTSQAMTSSFGKLLEGNVGGFVSTLFGHNSTDDLRRFGDELKKLQVPFNRLPLGKLHEIEAEAIKLGSDKSLEKWDPQLQKIAEGAHLAEINVAQNFQRMRQAAEGELHKLAGEAPGLGTAAVTPLMAAFKHLREAIGGEMEAGVKATEKGTQEIHSILASELKALGIKAPSARNQAFGPLPGGGANPLQPTGIGGSSGFQGNATGGKVTQPGYFAGEEAPTHPEFIIATNPAYRERNKQLWAQAGSSLGIPGFAEGGRTSGNVVLDPGVNMSRGVEPRIYEDLGKLSTELSQTIYVISGARTEQESAALGYPNDPHTRGEAADIGVGSSLRSSMDKVSEAQLRAVGLYRPFYRSMGEAEVNHVQLLLGVLGAAAGVGAGGAANAARSVSSIKAPHVGGAGMIGALTQGVVNKVAAAANQRLSGAGASAGGFGAAATSGLPAAARAKLMQIASQKHWSAQDWLGVIALESGGNPAAKNASGAYGIGQALGATQQQYPKMVSSSAVAQIEGMAEYIASRYGNPSAALAHEHSAHWYATGGVHGTATKPAKQKPGSSLKKIGKTLAPKQLQDLAIVGGKVNALYGDAQSKSTQLTGLQSLFQAQEGEERYLNLDGSLNAAGLAKKTADDQQLIALQAAIAKDYEQLPPILVPLLREEMGEQSKTAGKIKADNTIIGRDKLQLASLRKAAQALRRPIPDVVGKLGIDVEGVKHHWTPLVAAAQRAKASYHGKDKGTKERLTNAVSSAKASEQAALEPLQVSLTKAKAARAAHKQKVSAESFGLSQQMTGLQKKDTELALQVSALKEAGSKDSSAISPLMEIAAALGTITFNSKGIFTGIDTTDQGAAFNAGIQLISLNNDLQGVGRTEAGAAEPNSQLVSLQQQELQQMSQAYALSQAQYSVLAGFENIPRYDKGGPVLRDGLIYAHAGEHVVPRDGSLVRESSANVAAVHNNFRVDGNIAPLINIVDERIKHPDNIRVIQQRVGNRTSQLAGAPGGWR